MSFARVVPLQSDKQMRSATPLTAANMQGRQSDRACPQVSADEEQASVSYWISRPTRPSGCGLLGEALFLPLR
jgi:hypothetical protein